MGFNGWRNLSVLLLASAALVGCNNTPTNKTVVAPPKSGDPPTGLTQQKQGPFNGQGQPVGTANPSQFPRADSTPNPLLNMQGQGQPGLNSQFNQGAQQPKVGGDLPQFPKLPENSNAQQPNPFGPPANPNLLNQAPSVPNNQFGAGRITQPGTPQPDALQIPNGFPPR
jgi:hypothetical protein